MNVSGAASSLERFQAAIQAAKKRSVPAEAPKPTTKSEKIAALQATIKKAKMVKPASVSGTAFNKIYGGDSRLKSKAEAPKVGLQFDVYA